MRFATSHSIRCASDGSTRCFTISAEPGRQRNTCLMSVSVQPVGAAVVQASLHLSDSLSVDATILNIAGRTVRRLVDGKALPAGTSTLSWDRRGDRGTRVPSGRYVLQVVGRAESGAVSNIVRPFSVD